MDKCNVLDLWCGDTEIHITKSRVGYYRLAESIGCVC